MLGSGKLPSLGGSTPEAECQWWADRLETMTRRREGVIGSDRAITDKSEIVKSLRVRTLEHQT